MRNRNDEENKWTKYKNVEDPQKSEGKKRNKKKTNREKEKAK